MTAAAARPAWRPLLTGAARDRAAAWVERCATALADPDWSRFGSLYEHLEPARRVARAASVSGGCAGAALLLHRLGRDDQAQALLERAIAALGAGPIDAGLLTGLSGIAWVAAHLGAQASEPAGDPLAEIDTALAAAVADERAALHELGDGLAGVAVYFLERLPRPSAARALEAIVVRLASLAVAGPAGGGPDGDRVTWRAVAQPQVNLGMAHSAAGVIAVLARVVAAADEAPAAAARARSLVERAVAWLIAQRGSGISRYPGAVDARHGAIAPRQGWCQGDLGIAVALALAGDALGRDDWSREADATAHHAAGQPASDDAISEAGFCHGAVGLSHMYNRIYQRTGAPWCRAAAERWTARTLALEQPGSAVAGVVAWRIGPGGVPRWLPSPGLLLGATGVALALEALISDVAPTWDRALGLSGVAAR